MLAFHPSSPNGVFLELLASQERARELLLRNMNVSEELADAGPNRAGGDHGQRWQQLLQLGPRELKARRVLLAELLVERQLGRRRRRRRNFVCAIQGWAR